jgi:hypothetical protein
LNFFHSQEVLSELGRFGLGLDELGLQLETLDNLLVCLSLIRLAEGVILRDRLLLECFVYVITRFFRLRLKKSKVKEKSGRLLVRCFTQLDRLIISCCTRKLSLFLINYPEMILFALQILQLRILRHTNNLGLRLDFKPVCTGPL